MHATAESSRLAQSTRKVATKSSEVEETLASSVTGIAVPKRGTGKRESAWIP